MNSQERLVKSVLLEYGINVYSSAATAEAEPSAIIVNNPRFFQRVIKYGSLGLGESYMDGEWDCQALDQFFYKLIKGLVDKKINWRWFLPQARLWLKQKISRYLHRDPYYIGEAHYDKGNFLFQFMLGRSMAYSCGYWIKAKNLDEAQFNKYDLVCRKLYLQPGMTVLDIGCGWGSFAAYAAEKYGVKVLGITVSRRQIEYARQHYEREGVIFSLKDFREINGIFDRIVSIGMFEHVGRKNYCRFFQVVHDCLADDGIFLLHTIGSNTPVIFPDPWIDKYIFPGGYIPAASQIMQAAQPFLVLEDWHNFGLDYDKTLMAWYKNFEKNWPKFAHLYDQRFYRMWKYYLLSCAGLFRARGKQLWQIVFRKRDIKGPYIAVR